MCAINKIIRIGKEQYLLQITIFLYSEVNPISESEKDNDQMYCSKENCLNLNSLKRMLLFDLSLNKGLNAGHNPKRYKDVSFLKNQTINYMQKQAGKNLLEFFC